MSHHPQFRPILSLTLVLAGGWLLGILLPLGLPFCLGLALARLAEPLSVFFHRRLSLPPWLGQFCAVTLWILALAGAGVLALTLGGWALARLGAVLPALAESAAQGTQALREWVEGLCRRLPEPWGASAREQVARLFQGGTGLWDQAARGLPRMAAAGISALTGGAVTVLATLASAYLFLPRLETLRQWGRAHLPRSWREEYLPLAGYLGKAALGWLRAQGILMAVTFAIVSLGLLLLRVTYAPAWAAGIALLDALPLVGSGLILLPWALVSLIRGRLAQALGLVGIYALTAGSRWILESRLVGKELGLDPLVSLICLYIGCRLWGFGGVILGPALALILTLSLGKQPPRRRG